MVSTSQFARRGMRPIWIACLALLVTACIPTSENPLPISPGAPFDKSLYGAWLGHVDAEDDPVFLHFQKTQNGSSKAIMVTVHKDGESDGGWAEFDVTSSTLSNGSYLNLYWTESDGEPVEELNGIHLIRYVLDADGKLSLYFIDSDVIENAIENGDLDGTVKSSGFTRSIRITASSQELADFVDSKDPMELFTEFYGSFERAV